MTSKQASSPVAGLLLAAGLGTRMRSALPKVLHPVAGRPMLAWVLKAFAEAGASPACVVLSEERAGFADFLAAHPDLRVAIQRNRQGTGDAVAAAAWSFAGVTPAPFAAGYALQGAPIDCRTVLIGAGDTPAVPAAALRDFLAAFAASGAAVGVLGMSIQVPTGYGRLVTRAGELLAIVEEKDADGPTRAINVCNTGVIAADKDALFSLLHALRADNAQREYYLTDIVQHARARGLATMAHVAAEGRDFAGINNRVQLADVETWLVARLAQQLMLGGTTIRLPETVYLEADVVAGGDSEIGAGCRLLGRTSLGAGARLGAGVTLEGAEIGAGAVVGAGSVLRNCRVAPGEVVPPLSVRTS